ncbi:NAD(P)H-hydrate epimerase [Thelohanellus kitauei]|uniref:NAD(P)H-hydrate epimerase n=1 Tax=Thelohanellus kitauei TaxID=669202 RepID=A0A0C2IVX6_THEKT|nr:NAD(P)H-hydrate epimerase [Thelohanellus kitauei]
MRFLKQREALAIDKDLVEKYKFTIPQLMELAGLSASHAVYDRYKPKEFSKVLVCTGPGHNGGDGFVVARNLKLMGYEVSIFCPKEGQAEYLKNLYAQMPFFEIKVFSEISVFEDKLKENSYNLIIDAIFGFSFKPPLRPPFDTVVSLLSASKCPICSIDVPTGWLVDVKKNESELDHSICIQPETIVCLTGPKVCIESCVGRTVYLGGRFVPPEMVKEYGMDYPPYPQEKLIIKLDIK